MFDRKPEVVSTTDARAASWLNRNVVGMGAVNGVGDLGASVLVGSLWTAVSPSVAFAVAGTVMLLGSLQVARNSRQGVTDPS